MSSHVLITKIGQLLYLQKTHILVKTYTFLKQNKQIQQFLSFNFFILSYDMLECIPFERMR